LTHKGVLKIFAGQDTFNIEHYIEAVYVF